MEKYERLRAIFFFVSFSFLFFLFIFFLFIIIIIIIIIISFLIILQSERASRVANFARVLHVFYFFICLFIYLFY